MARPIEIPDSVSFRFALDGKTYLVMCDEAARSGVSLAAYCRLAVTERTRRDRSRRRKAAA